MEVTEVISVSPEINLDFSILSCNLPGFAFAWLELVSYRMFLSNLLLVNGQKGWGIAHQLLIYLFLFLEPHLCRVELTDAIKHLYKGALRVAFWVSLVVPSMLCSRLLFLVRVILICPLLFLLHLMEVTEVISTSPEINLDFSILSCNLPGFVFAWLKLVSHRMFLSNLLFVNGQKGWGIAH